LKTYIFVTNVYSVSKLVCGTFICPLSVWQLGLKLECICSTGKSIFYAFRDQQIIHVLNELQTDKRHIRVPQERLLCPTSVDNKNTQVFEKNIFLSVLHDQMIMSKHENMQFMRIHKLASLHT